MRVRQAIAGFVLPCDCLGAVYETDAGRLVPIVDARGDSCTEPGHRVGHPPTDTVDDEEPEGRALTLRPRRYKEA
jgi:hypothetical protein